jgi:CTP:molybdopterin cytidylyltransferase MocA
MVALPKIGNVLHMENRESFPAVILAAGLSGRMGVPKLSLRFRGGVSFAEECISQFKEFGCRQISLVVNQEGYDWLSRQTTAFPGNVSVVLNSYPGYGRFFSVQQGLLPIDKKQPVFIHNVDNPFVSHKALNLLQLARARTLTEDSTSEETCYFNPVTGERGGHPILLGSGIVDAIRQEKTRPESLKSFLQNFLKIGVGVDDPKIHVNINTLEDYRQYGLPLPV